MKRLLNSSSITGSGRAASATRAAARFSVRRSSRWLSAVTSAVQPGSTTVVALASRISAGPGMRSSRRQRLAVEHRRLVLGAGGPERDRVDRLRRVAAVARRQRRLLHPLAGGGHLGDAGLDHHLALRRGEAEALAVRGGEGVQHLGMRAEGHGQEAVGAGIAQVQPPAPRRCAPGRRPAPAAPRARPPPARRAALASSAMPSAESGASTAPSRIVRLVGEAHAVGREHAGEGVDEHRLHAELVRHQAGVLAAGAAEALQGEARRVLALLDGDLLDGVRHVGRRRRAGSPRRRGAASAAGRWRRRSRAPARRSAATRRRRRAAGRPPARRSPGSAAAAPCRA